MNTVTELTGNRMRLDKIVSWLSQKGYKQTANYFLSMVHDSCTVFYNNAFWIDSKVLENHLGNRLFKELETGVCQFMEIK